MKKNKGSVLTLAHYNIDKMWAGFVKDFPKENLKDFSYPTDEITGFLFIVKTENGYFLMFHFCLSYSILDREYLNALEKKFSIQKMGKQTYSQILSTNKECFGISFRHATQISKNEALTLLLTHYLECVVE